MSDSIGEFLKTARKSCGKTQTQVAIEMGITKSYISKLENNVKTPKMDTIKRFLKALNVKAKMVVTGKRGSIEFPLE